MQIARESPQTIHPKSPRPCFAGIGARTGRVPKGLAVSVERERVPGDAVPGDAVPGDAVPGDAVPGDAVPGDAVPGDAVPGEVVPGDAIPGQGVPGEQRPENAAEKRIVPLQGRAKEDRVHRTGEAVRGPEPLVDAGHTDQGLERAKEQTAARGGRGRGPRVRGGVCVEQPAAIRYGIGENLAAVRPVLLRRPDKERLDLIRGEVLPSP